MFKIAIFLKPYRKECIVGPAFKLLEAILELLMPTIMALIINNGVIKRDVDYVIKMGGLMVLMAILGFGSSVVCQYYAARASQGFGTTLRNKIFEHISSLSYAQIDKFGTPSLINRITNDVNQLQLAIAMLIRLVIRAPFICIGAVIMAMILDFKLSLILIAATPVFGIILYFIISRSSPLYRKSQQYLDKIALVLRENLSGVRVIRAFAKNSSEKQRFNQSNDDLTDIVTNVSKISALLNPLTSLVMNGAIIAVLWYGGLRINAGRLSQGEIIAYVNYITQILLALVVVSNLVIIFTRAFASAGRVNEVLETQSSIVEKNTVKDSNTKNINIKNINIKNINTENCNTFITNKDNPAIKFDKVSFGYSVTGDMALRDVSVEINHGETVGLIGSTGTGKSTFVNLIPRFYDAVTGEIYIDGINVKKYPLSVLKSKISVVPQKSILFTGTIAENIRWGKQDATDEEVMAAAKIAQAEEFILSFSGGYSTKVSRGGANFSGGQKQRLAIARALVVQPEILILDDASCALDFATEAALKKAIKQNCSNMTVLIVSQRVSTVKHADKIIVFGDGYIEGIGTHDELMENCKVYNEICISQLSNGEAVV
ncbi:ABC transporter ATP-binding protein [Pseudobacteroides cellulosolvens]|uniref:Xenobiotic-transporting ATPase n=1 Tax=Pseudobacteroides cellulosolvens ATCC 35603 = DSM 2933 TaxID=398512 RepID=A0A0L6JJD9_9FIRM|nr:ABC transporter ATP-binding protein [Pseudobacteroides cellulosolvens]KNY25798.1 Xenobiotic-transporting ATPase [Pseudobacteroides cellulosolvens ATCC 35603 = DSM 2933]